MLISKASNVVLTSAAYDACFAIETAAKNLSMSLFTDGSKAVVDRTVKHLIENLSGILAEVEKRRQDGTWTDELAEVIRITENNLNLDTVKNNKLFEETTKEFSKYLKNIEKSTKEEKKNVDEET